MIVSYAQKRTVARREKFILVDQLQPRVHIVLVQKVNCRLERVTVKIVKLTRTTCMVKTPNKCGCPVPTVKWLVVLEGSGCPTNVNVRLLPLGTAQETVTYLEGPVVVRHYPKAR